MRQVIIASAGKATRFANTLKELLPINSTETALSRSIHNAVIGMNAQDLVLITSTEKIGTHAEYLQQHTTYFTPISYKVQSYGNDLWGAILTGLTPHVDGGLVLPDTVTLVNPEIIPNAPIVFGVFTTHTPERFSVIHSDKIHTKQHLSGTHKAWGIVLWSKEVARYWLEDMPNVEHYDEAFQYAMDTYGYATFDLPYYYDLGTFSDYAAYLRENAL